MIDLFKMESNSNASARAAVPALHALELPPVRDWNAIGWFPLVYWSKEDKYTDLSLIQGVVHHYSLD